MFTFGIVFVFVVFLSLDHVNIDDEEKSKENFKSLIKWCLITFAISSSFGLTFVRILMFKNAKNNS